MIDNFDKIKSLLRFENDNDFYFLQIIKRKKDNPGLEKSEKTLKNYFIYSLDEFDALKPKVIDFCIENNARGYFRLNKRNGEMITLQMMKRLVDNIVSKQYRNIENMYSSVCGSYNSDPNKTWVLDVDDDQDGKKIKHIKDILLEKDIIYNILQTKNGCHVITPPFDQRLMPSYLCDIHKDNPTILFIP